jgi:hypothetical protein
MTEFLGPEGLAEFLDILDTKVLPMRDVFTMIQRLHMPGYEEARPHFEEATAAEATSRHPNGIYKQKDIEATLAFTRMKQ